MIRYFVKALVAEVRSTALLYLLTLLGVGLGVAAVTAIQLINRNSIAAFEAGIEAGDYITQVKVELKLAG